MPSVPVRDDLFEGLPSEEAAPVVPAGTVERGDSGSIERIRFVVPGKPLTWARARRGKHGPSYTPEDRVSKMTEVRDAYRSLGIPPFSRDAYLAMGVIVFCERPSSHWRTNGELKPRAVLDYPGAGTNGGDLDNFVKLVKDALEKVAYHNDTQIVRYVEPTGKFYTQPPEFLPKTIVTIEPVRPVDLAEVGGQESLIPVP